MGEAEDGPSTVYHVFINHRGPDTKKDVANLIYRGLTKYGLTVFLDQDELKVGDVLDEKIKSAISSSSVHVAIFSVRYAESAWCLNELLDMLQSGCKIIPIFYNVKPAHLRHIENGPYAKAFRKHQDNGRNAMELVEKWKNALQKVSNISGREYITKKNDLGDLVDEIVEEVLKEAKWELLWVAEHPVSLHEAAEDFNHFLKERQLSGTTVVGIIGLDGSGKSTLVKQLYNWYLKSREFKRYCFLSELNKKDLEVLKQKLLRDLSGDDKYGINDGIYGNGDPRKRLEGCGPALIVLDGLDKVEQIENLLLVGKEDKKYVLAEGSLILVTCHDKALLENHQVNLFYKVKLLQGKDAHDLFCWYAFDEAKPPPHLEDLVEKFLEICCGFPLALKVLGRKLSVKQDRRYWEEQFKDLSSPELPRNIVDEILKVSYNYLWGREKEIFLDVAHFLVGEDTDLAVRVLEGLHVGSGLMCLEALQSKCLLDLEEIKHCKRPFAKGPGIQWRTKGSSKIRMHDLVRKMAIQIAIEDFRSSLSNEPLRLCQLDTQSILHLIQDTDNHVRGIRYEDKDVPHQQPHAKLNRLRLLVIQGYWFPFPFDRLSGDLIWLRIHKFQMGNTIPHTLLLQNLRILELDRVNLDTLGRMDSDEFPSKLCELTVDCFGESEEIPRRNLPSSSRVDKNSKEASSSARGSFWDWFIVRELTDLFKMVLKNVKGLKSLPIDFKAVRNLRHLDLSGCSELERMPESFTGLLQLQYLALQNCRRLSISDLGEITKLEYLDFEGCSLLRNLPDKTTAQRGLRYLNLMRTSIEELPQDFGELKKLEQLLITSSYLRTLPRSFHQLGQLRILTLSECLNLRDISSSISIEHFPYLESLKLWEVGVITVPQGIAWSRVKLLHVRAPHLSEFSFERDQGKLSLDRTKSVEATGHNRVSSLTELRLVKTHISNLWFPPEESLFPDLEIVDLSGNHRLRDVQSLPCNLKRLYLMHCTALSTLLCLSNLACLRILDISGCHKLEALNLEGLTSIEETKANDCRELQSIQGLANLACMRILDISGCHKLEALNLEGLTSIEETKANDCRELQSIQGLANLACMRKLDISGCRKLKALNLEGLRSIKEIEAKECSNLQSIQGLAQLHTLSYLNFSTFNEDPNSTIWSEILGFPSNVSTVILGRANVLCKNHGEMDSVTRSIEEFQGVNMMDIPIIGKEQQVPLKNMEYETIILCLIAKNNFIDFEVSVNYDVYSFRRPSFVTCAEVHVEHEEHEETLQMYTFMWSKSVRKCTIRSRATLKASLREARVVLIRNRRDGVKVCKQLLNSLYCIPREAVHHAVAL